MKNYYSILNKTIDGLSGHFVVRLNPECKVYEGHFPGEPVSPGVCNIEMLLECAAQVRGYPLRARKISRCRLTTLITPLSHPELELHIDLKEKEPALFVLNAEIGKDADNYMSLRAEVTRDE